MICLIALLSERPNAAILKEAVNDLISRQPVLGCQFDETQEPPVWKLIADGRPFSELAADDLHQGLEALLKHTSPQCGPMEVTLLSMPGQTAICLRLDHAVTDGGGAKACLTLLARCYQARLGSIHEPEACFPDRSDSIVYERCGVADYRRLLHTEAPAAGKIATVPFLGTEGQSVRYQWTTMPLSAVKPSNGTINDAVLAAYLWTLAKICPDAEVLSIHLTVDLRRFLEVENRPLAANLSGMASVSLPNVPGESYAGILAEVTRQTAQLKEKSIGLSGAAMMTYLGTLPYAQAKAALTITAQKSRASSIAAPLLSNLGLAASEVLTFGSATVTNIIPLLPAMHAPSFMLGVSGYEDTLTLSVGYYAEERQSTDMEACLTSLLKTLQDTNAAGEAVTR